MRVTGLNAKQSAALVAFLFLSAGPTRPLAHSAVEVLNEY